MCNIIIHYTYNVQGGNSVNLINKIKKKLIQKQSKVDAVAQVDEMANGLEEMVNKQLSSDKLSPRTRKQLENVLEELDDYRKKNEQN